MCGRRGHDQLAAVLGEALLPIGDLMVDQGGQLQLRAFLRGAGARHDEELVERRIQFVGLGERRGNAVSSAIQANGGSGSQQTVVSYGEERPVCTATNEDCWAKNRRVEIIYTAK